MTTSCVGLDYTFHPVGQGLFSSGCIYQSNQRSCNFLWVYDCGTASARTLIKDGIENLSLHVGGRKTIDVLAVSHFDKDHISGIALLISKFRVNIILLPYMSLWQRLVIAFEQGISFADPALNFFVDPAAYLSDLNGAIDRIIFVPPSDDQGPPNPDPDQIDPPSNLDDLAPNAEIDNSHDYEDYGPSVTRSRSVGNVRFLKPGTSLTIPGLWEFVPYNDAGFAPVLPTFAKSVAALCDALRNASTTAESEAILTQLKNIYDMSFGKSAKHRNVISLFLYGGPIGRRGSATGLVDIKSTKPWPWPYPARYPCFHRTRGDARKLSEKCGILYSGDGYLDNASRLHRLLSYLSPTRVGRIAVFQVMHHGARSNWHKGVAAAIRPEVSIFSSDPLRTGLLHPHAQVRMDFCPYGPIQVDQKNGTVIPAWMLP